jgi:hypothetical protein
MLKNPIFKINLIFLKQIYLLAKRFFIYKSIAKDDFNFNFNFKLMNF